MSIQDSRVVPSSRPQKSSMAWIRRLAVLGSVGALVAVGATPAIGQAAPNGAAPENTSTLGTQRITLVTGDVVTVTTGPDGRHAASVTPADPAAPGGFATVTAHGRTYVYPHAAMPLIASGKLDRELFDVTELAADGYDDAHTAALPLIVSYGPATPGRAAAAMAPPAGSTRTKLLASINGAALGEDKTQAARFWSAISGTPATAPGATRAGTAKPATALAQGIHKIWLDGKVKVDLAQSVPQIGAPQAWQAGYDGKGVSVAVLDTGIDATHPDLAGKIAQTQNFSSSPDVVDRFGHGTHVADTIVGSGAASNGARKGVAPGAQLYIGKVLGDDGSGSDRTSSPAWNGPRTPAPPSSA
jgi:Subtilase family